MKLRQGNSDHADMVSNAMNATDSVLAMSKNMEGETSKRKDSVKHGKTVKGKTKSLNRENKRKHANQVFKVLDKYANTDNSKTGARVATALINAIKGKNNAEDNTNRTGGILKSIKQCVGQKQAEDNKTENSTSSIKENNKGKKAGKWEMCQTRGM